jgi:hypothetical protein
MFVKKANGFVEQFKMNDVYMELLVSSILVNFVHPSNDSLFAASKKLLGENEFCIFRSAIAGPVWRSHTKNEKCRTLGNLFGKSFI